MPSNIQEELVQLSATVYRVGSIVHLDQFCSEDGPRPFLPIDEGRENLIDEVKSLYAADLFSPNPSTRERAEELLELLKNDTDPYQELIDHFDEGILLNSRGDSSVTVWKPDALDIDLEKCVKFIEQDTFRQKILAGNIYQAVQVAYGVTSCKFEVTQEFYILDFHNLSIGSWIGHRGMDTVDTDVIHTLFEESENRLEIVDIIQALTAKQDFTNHTDSCRTTCLLSFETTWEKSGCWEYEEWDSHTVLQGVVDTDNLPLMPPIRRTKTS